MQVGHQFEFYIRESDARLRTDENIIIHLDGVDFTHKYYRQTHETSETIYQRGHQQRVSGDE